MLIPKDFSAKIATILEENPQKPEIDYSVNEKINAIAPKITTTGASGVVAQVSENFVKTASEAIFTIFNEVGIKLEQELPTIRNIENRIFELEKRLPDIEQAGNKALAFEKKLPEIRKQSEKVIELEKKLPEIKKQLIIFLYLRRSCRSLKKLATKSWSFSKSCPKFKKRQTVS